MHKTLEQAGVDPIIYIMDNEISQELIQVLEQKKAKYQLAPRHAYRRNLVECLIQTYKNHFKACLESVDPHFTLSEWDIIIV